MKLLVVEDEIKLGLSLKKGLEQKGFAVDLLSNGQEAVDHLEVCHDEYDLAVVDVMLPGRSGIELCRILRRQGIHVPVLLLTAKDSVSDRIMGLESGADDYVLKPFDFTELVARIRTILRRPASVCMTLLTFGKLSLNPASRKVSVDEREIPLTQKEFAILEFMMRNAGVVLSRETIQSHVWDQAFDSFSNVIDVHIAGLKKKLGKGKYEKYIETVRGIGYRFHK